jgi:hypothetical protein
MFKNEVIQHVIPRKETIEEANAKKYSPMVNYDCGDIKFRNEIKKESEGDIEVHHINKYYQALDYYEGGSKNNKFIYNKLIEEKDYGELMDYLLLQPHYQYMNKEILYYYCRTLVGMKLTKNDYKKIAKQEKKEIDKMKNKDVINLRKKKGDFTVRF